MRSSRFETGGELDDRIQHAREDHRGVLRRTGAPDERGRWLERWEHVASRTNHTLARSAQPRDRLTCEGAAMTMMARRMLWSNFLAWKRACT